MFGFISLEAYEKCLLCLSPSFFVSCFADTESKIVERIAIGRDVSTARRPSGDWRSTLAQVGEVMTIFIVSMSDM